MGHLGTIPRVRELNPRKDSDCRVCAPAYEPCTPSCEDDSVPDEQVKSWPPDPVRGSLEWLTPARRADLVFIGRWILRPTRPAPDLRYWVKQARTRLLEADAELGPI